MTNLRGLQWDASSSFSVYVLPEKHLGVKTEVCVSSSEEFMVHGPVSALSLGWDGVWSESQLRAGSPHQ